MGKIIEPVVKPKTILAIDPGVTTGLAYKLPDGSYQTVALGQYEEDAVWNSITPNLDLVIYENFKCVIISKFGLYTVRLIGGIQALCKSRGIRLVKQEPADRKPFVVLAASYLKEHDHTTWMIHQKDALAQLMCYEYRNGNTQHISTAVTEEMRKINKQKKPKPAYRGLGRV